MQIKHITYPMSISTATIDDTVSAIGFFDGVHKGHQKVIQTAVDEARARNMKSAVITFHPHPSVVLNQDNQPVKYITSPEEKEEILKEMHVDLLYVIEFSRALSQLSPQAFLDHFITGLQIKHLVAGFDFTFGYKGQGNMNNIQSYSKGNFTTTLVPKVEICDGKISSTRIKQLLSLGKVDQVNHLLNRPFRVKGSVIDGNKRGRKIGYPTANIKVNKHDFLPKIGVYAVKVKHKNSWYEGMASLGTNPTFKTDEANLSLEVYIFDFDEFIYGEILTLEFHSFIRDEKTFLSVDDLISALEQDEANIRAYFLNNYLK